MEKKKESFELQMFKIGLIPNVLSVCIYLIYLFIFAQIKLNQILSSWGFGFLLLVINQFGIGFFSNKYICGKITSKLVIWKKNSMTEKERTKLLKDVLAVPIQHALSVFVMFSGCTIIWALWMILKVKASLQELFFSIISALFVAFLDAIINLFRAEKACSNIAIEIIETGVSEKEVIEKRFFGISMKKMFIISVYVPILFSGIITCFYFIQNTSAEVNFLTIVKIVFFILFNSGITMLLSSSFALKILDYMQKMHRALQHISENDIYLAKKIPTDLSNEISHNLFLVNKTIGLFHKIFDSTTIVAKEILESTQALALVSGETSQTAIEQSTGVKEIVSTMEDTEILSHNITNKISDVNLVATKTAKEVTEGFASLNENLEKMKQITEANMNTISGIRELGEKIEGIWDIVNIINSIAEQTKIIAFNAELEAASAGAAGKNFHIVANEIRRLADNTTNSTKEIKKRITEIQHSSDNLIITSEGGTEKIQEGCDLSAKMEQNFASIRNSAEITADSASDIQQIVSQQTASFEQILVTLKQIAIGIEASSNSTQSIAIAADNLQASAGKLSDLTYQGENK